MTTTSRRVQLFLRRRAPLLALAAAGSLMAGLLVVALAGETQDSGRSILAQGAAAQVSPDAPTEAPAEQITATEVQEPVAPSTTEPAPAAGKVAEGQELTRGSTTSLPATTATTGGARGTTAASTTTLAPVVTGSPGAVRGTVLVSPACPVERTPPDPSCAPRPGAADIRLIADDGRVAASARADAAGAFHIPVAPGRYRVEAVPPATGIGKGCEVTPSTVTVVGGAVASVTVTCDSGIR